MLRTLAGRTIALAVAALVAVPATASAQITIHTTLASWLGAVGANGVDTYNDLPSASITGPLNRTAGTFGYTASVTNPSGGSTDFFPAGTNADRWLSTDNALANIVFDNFSPDARGVAGEFFLSDISGSFVGTGQLTVTYTSGVTATVTFTNPSVGNFWGITSTQAIASLVVSAVQPTNGSPIWPTVNNLRIGAAPTSTVPEPSTYALLAVGLGGIGITGWRRRARLSA